MDAARRAQRGLQAVSVARMAEAGLKITTELKLTRPIIPSNGRSQPRTLQFNLRRNFKEDENCTQLAYGKHNASVTRSAPPVQQLSSRPAVAFLVTTWCHHHRQRQTALMLWPRFSHREIHSHQTVLLLPASCVIYNLKPSFGSARLKDGDAERLRLRLRSRFGATGILTLQAITLLEYSSSRVNSPLRVRPKTGFSCYKYGLKKYWLVNASALRIDIRMTE